MGCDGRTHWEARMGALPGGGRGSRLKAGGWRRAEREVPPALACLDPAGSHQGACRLGGSRV